jgi:pilus assembly protein CpaB
VLGRITWICEEVGIGLIRRWSPSSKVFAVLAVVTGVAAYLVVDGYAKRVAALAPGLGEPVEVAVAVRDLPRGTTLDPTMLRTVTYPGSLSPPGAIAGGEGASGRVLLAPLAEGEPVTQTRLGPARAGPVAALVPEGLRAVVVATSLPAGTVRAGDLVDVLATFAQGRPYTETVASEVEVLGVVGFGTLTRPGADPPAHEPEEAVTLVLAVTPDLAERLAYARAFADLSVAIVGPPDVSSTGSEVVAP